VSSNDYLSLALEAGGGQAIRIAAEGGRGARKSAQKPAAKPRPAQPEFDVE
jgi:hypothetical protein